MEERAVASKKKKKKNVYRKKEKSCSHAYYYLVCFYNFVFLIWEQPCYLLIKVFKICYFLLTTFIEKHLNFCRVNTNTHTHTHTLVVFLK